MIPGRIQPGNWNAGHRPDVVRAGPDKELEAGGRDDGAPRRGARYTGFVIVRLGEGARDASLDKYETLADLAKAGKFRDLARVLDAYDLKRSQRLVHSTPPSKIRELEARAAHTALPPLHSLVTYWRLDLRGQADRMEEVIKALSAVPEVDRAYPELPGGDPFVNAGDDTYNAQQDYLDPAPGGIDARWAWTQPNGEGTGIAVIDMEQGWFLNHEDYTAKAPAVIAGDNRDGIGGYVGNHGTAVLGEMIGDDNTLGIVGIAPSAGPVNCASHFDSGLGTNGHVADAVAGAIGTLSAGDILVIEYQTTGAVFGAPAEFEDANFDAIRLASALGIVVFEAAGNGSNNLDTLANGGLQVLNPASADFRESGAIIVGAAVDTVPHNRAGFSSFGARVNCYGWGQNVVTCGYGDLDNGGGDNDETYTAAFNGTSSATPIVAGAGLVVQGMMEANTGARLSPQQMRLLLSNPATGTPQGAGVAGNIGVMPDLRAIIEDTLGLSADVYLRDNVGDDGSVPTAGGISASPDIIARPAQVADGNASFGEGSGTENDASQGYKVESGQDNYIYVRMKNRGAADANDVTARIYWSDVSTLVTPDMWTEIGVTDPVDVPQGDTLVVAEPLTWAEADIPATGHYCFVGILDHPADPAPPTPSPTDWAGFQSFIRNQNNVTWRNFNVVDEIGDPSADPYAAPFLIANAPDARRFFDFVIEQRLAKGLKVALELPLEILKPFLGGLDVKYRIDRKKGVAAIELPRIPRLVVPRVLLPPKARLRCRLLVRGLAKHGVPGNQISIGQHFEQFEVGRITWRFIKKRERKQA
jgi:hypothetical protein